MKVLILAGGFGTRLSEETGIRPKPMVEIGDKPILWHIMKHYSSYGYNDFVILCGYMGSYIKEYFANYYVSQSSITFDLKNNSMETISSEVEPWKVTLLDTGLNTMTGGRIKKAKDIIGNEPFLLTYGDGVSDVNIEALVAKHKEEGKLCTMTAVQPGGRFGALIFDADTGDLREFKEKPKSEGGWINGGFFVCEPEVFDYIEEGEDAVFEKKPLEKLALDSKINCYKHSCFWKCMDTLNDKKALNSMWDSGEAKWKTW